MKNNFKYTLVILAILLIPALVVFIAAAGTTFGHFGPFQYLFASDAREIWNPLVDYAGSVNRPPWPEFSLFIPTIWQAVISVILLIIAFLLAFMNSNNQAVRVAAMLLATFTITRHLLWRGFYTIDTDNPANAVVGVILFIAEIAAFIAMLLGYFQMYKPTPSPKIDISQYPEAHLPAVDVYICTYNEGTDILYRSIVGAKNIDYPKKQVYLLDDGNRPEVKELAHHLGVGYITRPTNEHAKAGNMNNALQYTNGDLVTIFDADHIATTNFLQETVGLFMQDEKVAYVQTPQFFFTPDPFQRNLVVEKAVTNEQDLFYQVIQPGNNYWGSAFFAGSGAVFRKKHLEEIGGFAIETITEDTHTGIRLHAKGLKSFYVNKVLAAGMAQDSFMDYLNQRLRWGRGMFQILRYDNPLFVPGLRFGQRLCYFSGIYYFFHGLPRIIFLLSPLCFLAGGLKPIDAQIFEMIIYYVPSFLITILSFSIVTKGIRQTFWSEVYESATSLYLFITTTLAIVLPGRARFKVTPKGTMYEETTFQWITIIPQLVIASLTMIGLVLGLVRIFVNFDYAGGIFPNIFWASYNLILMIGAIIVAANRPQYRSSPRIFKKIRCELGLVDNTYAVGYTTNISETGLAVELEKPVPVSDVVTIRITDTDIGVNTTLTGQVVRSSVNKDNRHYLGLRLINRTDQQHQNLVRHMFTAPNNWDIHWEEQAEPAYSFGKLVSTLFRWSSIQETPLYRVAPRFDASLSCVLMVNNQTLTGVTREISETGVAVNVNSPTNLNIGDRLYIRIQWPDSKISELPCEVARLIKPGRANALIGLKFLNLSIEQKVTIINYLYKQANAVVRVAPNFRRTLSCLVVKEGLAEPLSGFTYEISETSLSVGVKTVPFAVGDQVKLMLQWEDMSKLEFDCAVANVHPAADHFMLTLNYLNMSQKQRQELIKKLYAKVDEQNMTATQLHTS